MLVTGFGSIANLLAHKRLQNQPQPVALFFGGAGLEDFYNHLKTSILQN